MRVPKTTSRVTAMLSNLLVKRTCASYSGWPAYRARYASS